MPKLIFADGLGQYADAAATGRRFLTAGGALTSYTRTSGATAKETAATNVGPQIAVNPSTTTQGAVGARFIYNTLNIYNWMCIYEVSTPHLSLGTNADGSLTVRRGNLSGGTVLGSTAAGVVSVGTRYYVELKFTIHDTTGAAEVRVNEVVVLTLTNVDTRNGGNGVWTMVGFISESGAGNFRVGDIHIHDATTTHDYGGDLQTDDHYPNGAGATTGGTPSAGANYQCVDDNPSNGDTDYVTKTAAATKDTYAYQNLIPTGSAIKAVTPVIDVKKIDAGTALFKTITRRGGVDYQSTNAVAPSAGSYRYLSDLPMETDPSTGVAWTEANFNAAEFGDEKTA